MLFLLEYIKNYVEIHLVSLTIRKWSLQLFPSPYLNFFICFIMISPVDSTSIDIRKKVELSDNLH